MKRPRVIGILLAVAILGWLGWVNFHDREPSYQGRTVTEWVYLLRETSDDAEAQTCKAALQALGTNALPTLLRMIAATDGPIKSRFMSFGNDHPFFSIGLRSETFKHRAGRKAFVCLRGNASPAIPTLVRLLNSRNDEVFYAAYGCLKLIPVDKSVVLPTLAEGLSDRDKLVTYRSAIAICSDFPEDAERLGVYKLYPILQSEMFVPARK
jgi:hypothetical protein